MFHKSTKLSLRSVKSGKIIHYTIGEFFEYLRSQHSNPNKTCFDIKEFDVLSGMGWVKLKVIHKINYSGDAYSITTESFTWIVCRDQKLMKDNTTPIKSSQLKVGDVITTELGLETIQQILTVDGGGNMYDLNVKTEANSFFIDGMLSA